MRAVEDRYLDLRAAGVERSDHADHRRLPAYETCVRRTLRRVPAGGLCSGVVARLVADVERAGLPALLLELPQDCPRDLQRLVTDRALQREIRRNDGVRRARPLVDHGPARRRGERRNAAPRAACAARITGRKGGNQNGRPQGRKRKLLQLCLLRPDSISAERWYEERVFRAPVPFSSAAELAGTGLRWPGAEVAELVDAPDSKSGSPRGVWVRFPPSASSFWRFRSSRRRDTRREARYPGSARTRCARRSGRRRSSLPAAAGPGARRARSRRCPGRRRGVTPPHPSDRPGRVRGAGAA